jgi:hypothetical protein
MTWLNQLETLKRKRVDDDESPSKRCRRKKDIAPPPERVASKMGIQ